MQYIWIINAVIILWLLLITYLFLRLSSHYNNLMRGVKGNTLQAVLDKLIQDVTLAKKDIAFLRQMCDKMEKEGQLHIQKIGLLRFNPFKDTGGDQSFILALVDGQDTGVVISGLYSRSGTRWYAKRVYNGNPLDHELSEEEKKALKEATRISRK